MKWIFEIINISGLAFCKFALMSALTNEIYKSDAKAFSLWHEKFRVAIGTFTSVNRNTSSFLINTFLDSLSRAFFALSIAAGPVAHSYDVNKVAQFCYTSASPMCVRDLQRLSEAESIFTFRSWIKRLLFNKKKKSIFIGRQLMCFLYKAELYALLNFGGDR